jgi:hypothetical protein
VFDHAEFGIIVIPAYSDPWWKEHGQKPARKTWHWLHGVNRVLSHVLKSLVLVYVDVLPPPVFEKVMATEGPDGGISGALKKYRIREIMVRRWSSNRNRWCDELATKDIQEINRRNLFFWDISGLQALRKVGGELALLVWLLFCGFKPWGWGKQTSNEQLGLL